MSLQALVDKTCAPSTPCQLIDVVCLEELIDYINKASPPKAAVETILKHLMPHIKSNEPKPVLAALKVMEMLMVQIGAVFCKATATEEWGRRLGKLVNKTKEPILRMTVLQHLADWIEMFEPICDVTWLIKEGNKLGAKGHHLPQPSPNARAHAARLKAIAEAEKEKEATPAAPVESDAPATPEPPAAPVPESQASAGDDASSDISDEEEEDELEEEEAHPDEDFDDVTEDALRLREDLVTCRHELRAFRAVHRSTAGKLRRRLTRKTEKLSSIESRLGNDPDKLDFMRKVNRELADAQRKLLNLQYTWTNMEAEVTELEWQETKGKEELQAVEQLGKTLAAELKERRLEQEETDAELAENKEILAKLQLQHKRAKGEALDGTSREELTVMKTTLTTARAAIQKLIEAKEA